MRTERIEHPARAVGVAEEFRPDLPPGHSPRTEANARLTSMAGLLLIVLLAVQGVTILRIHRLLTVHVVVGLVLLGPLAVKLGSVGWRFLRYYSRDTEYGRAGAPRPLLRLLAPFVVLTTILVFASGIALLAVRPGHGSTLLFVHKASFILWFGVMTIHVLAYVIPAIRRTVDDVAGRGPVAVLRTRRARQLLLGAGVLAGVALGAAGLNWAHAWTAWFSARANH